MSYAIKAGSRNESDGPGTRASLARHRSQGKSTSSHDESTAYPQRER